MHVSKEKIDNLIARLRNHNSVGDEAADIIEALRRQVSELEYSYHWIPVTEKLPPNGVDVEVYRPSMQKVIHIDQYYDESYGFSGWARYGKDIYGNDVITHWRHIVNPIPKKEN